MSDPECQIERVKFGSHLEDEVAVVVVARDERERLEGFFHHYEGLGCRNFWFIDNGSTDGTKEFLLARDDVTLFETDANYSDHRKGLRWSRAICDRYLDGKWIITVDVDELLVWPRSTMMSIFDLLEYFEENRFEAIFTLMYDFFPPRENWSNFSAKTDFLDVAPCVITSNFTSARARHFPFIQVRGGIRAEILESGAKPPIVQKLPIIKWRAGRYYLKSTHYVSESLRVADITGGLLHFKFSASSSQKFRDEVERGQRWQGGVQYAAYADAVEDHEIFYNSGAVLNYPSLESIEASNLLRTTRKFERYLERKIDGYINAGTSVRSLEYRDMQKHWPIVQRMNSPQFRNFLDTSFSFDCDNIHIEENQTAGA